MAKATIIHVYDAPVAKVFDVYADIENVQDISPNIESSKRLNKKHGLGGQRECDFGKNAGIHEEVTAFEKNKQIQFTGIKMWGAPMTKMVAVFDFHEENAKTTVTCEMDYDMKLGWIMNPIAKPMIRKNLKAMLLGAEGKL